jgi:alpha,alpha-trehalase
MKGVFEDSKQFADAIPRESPASIMATWTAERGQPGFALRAFVDAHFQFDAPVSPPVPQAGLDLCSHINGLWNVLTRRTPEPPPGSSLLSLPHPAIVPGGRFRELYYWDSYFSLLGVTLAGRADLLEGMVDNFASLIDRYGHIPNGTRTYYLSRSQPPFFYEMVGLISPDDPASAYERYLPALRREHAFWMAGEDKARPGAPHRRVVALDRGVQLNRYWDDRAAPRDESYREDVELAKGSPRPAAEVYRDLRAAAESGWDFSSRWLADGKTLASIETTRIVPVDLNSLLFGLESAIRLGCERAEDRACVEEFTKRAADRRAAIDRYLWQEEKGVYGDYHWRDKRPTDRLSAAVLYPLFTGVASADQAQKVARVVRSELLDPGGLATTQVETGQQWDRPNGWAPLQWIAVRGLQKYSQAELARTIAERWLANVNRVYEASGKLVEKYDVVDVNRPGGGGEYPLQDGFGWTNGVTVKLMQLFPNVHPACYAPAGGATATP